MQRHGRDRLGYEPRKYRTVEQYEVNDQLVRRVGRYASVVIINELSHVLAVVVARLVLIFVSSSVGFAAGFFWARYLGCR